MAELVVAPPTAANLTIYEADFIEGLTLQAAVALENARNHERNLQWARVQQDLDAARNIQRSLLPQKLPQISGYSMAFRSVTCYEVGGDYLDIVEQPDGSLLIAVADVAGKGLASAMMSTNFSAAFRAMAITGMPLDDLATRMNQHHWTEGEEARRRYVTAIFLRLHPETGKMEVVNAGHNPGFLRRSSAARHMNSRSIGTPLGLLPGMQYSIEESRFDARITAFVLYRWADGSVPRRRRVWPGTTYGRIFEVSQVSRPMLFSIHCGQQLRNLPRAVLRVMT